jgi:hypothetical protein
MTLVVDGLNNTYRYDRRQKRVLTLDFSRPGDEFYPDRESLTYQGKDWEWLWMWYEDLTVGPLEPHVFETPSGMREAPKVLWAFLATLTNSTGERQKIELREFNVVVRLVRENILGVSDIEVEFVDDGSSTIHKARVMENMAQPFQGSRFFSGELAPDEPKVFPVIFDLDDIDWEKVYEQVERGLTGDIAIGYGEAPLKPGMESYRPTRDKLRRVKVFKLSDEQKEQVRREVMAAVPEALDAEKERKILSADVSAVAGIATGTYRIMRSYFRKGVIEAEWIQKWEEGL